MFGRIVVGVDGSEGSLPALQWAVDEARRRGATVEAVLVWQSMTTAGFGEVPYLPDEEARIVGVERERLDRAVALALAGGDSVADDQGGGQAGGEGDGQGGGGGDGQGDVHPGFAVEPVVVEGDAADVLCERSERADLLVVGLRGHGALYRLLQGSVSSTCIRHSRCPIVVVPQGQDDGRADGRDGGRDGVTVS